MAILIVPMLCPQVTLDLLASEELDKVINNFFILNLSDREGLVANMLASVRDSVNNPVLESLKERALPILRDTLMYQHNGLVSTALSLIFRLIMMRAETTSLLQEVQLLQSKEMVNFYHQACSHALRLQSFFNNKVNLRGQWCDSMLQELQWFTAQVCEPHNAQASARVHLIEGTFSSRT